MQPPKPTKLLILMALIYLATIGLQLVIDPYRQKYLYAAVESQTRPGQPISPTDKPPIELLGGAFLGFREVAAGLLWVRADEYFHTGKYDQLVPLFYLVTWMDPHQIDVYSTGAWHLAYNLGDQRLIPEGVKFLNQGMRDNPNVWDLFFQQAYMANQKTKDHAMAVQYSREASTKLGTDGKPAPPYIFNTIAHSLEQNGQIKEMFAQWEANVNRSQDLLIQALLKKKPAFKSRWEQLNATTSDRKAVQTFLSDPEVGSFINEDLELKPMLDSLQVQTHNLNTNYLRRDYFRKGAGEPGYKFDWNAKPNPHWTYVGGTERHRIDTKFDYEVRRIGKRKIEVSGHLEGADFQQKLKNHRLYTRLAVTFRDKNYEKRYADHAGDFEWQKNNLTYYTKEISFPTEAIQKGQESTDFRFILDFSKDPEEMHKPEELFPFKADEYELTVTLDPTRQSLLHQDVYGWKGEGLTDDKYLVTDKRGIRIVTKTVTLKRGDVI